MTMSLLRLLTTGKSLIGLKKSENRYQLPGHRTLPQFGSKKNPFRATAFPEKVEVPSQVSSRSLEGTSISDNSQKDRGNLQPAEVVEDGGSRNEDLCSATRSNVNGTRDKITTAAAPERPRSAIRAFLLWGRAKAKRPTGSTIGRQMVQSELSLDSVRVMRNDLSESDLEIVRARQEPISGKAADSRVGDAPNLAAEPGWGAAANRLFGLGKM
jgi:hypothetical protein